MSQTIRFHLDENASSAIANGLKQHGIDVSTTPEVGLISASDVEQMEFARMQSRVIFTQDRDFLRLHYAGTDHAGIAYCIKDSRSIGKILRGLILIWEVLDPEAISGRVEFL